MNALELINHLNNMTEFDKRNASVGENHKVKIAIDTVLNGTRDVMSKKHVHLGVSYALDQDFWNDYGIYGPRKEQIRKSFCGRTFRYGEVLKIDFGHLNVGYEHSYLHMAIVVEDFKGLLVVVPIQSDRGQKFTPDTQRAILPMLAQDFSFLKHNSLLLVHQLRVIAKNRINKVLGVTIDKTQLMDDLENKIQQLYTPKIRARNREQIERLRREVEQNQIVFMQKEEELVSIKEQFERELRLKDEKLQIQEYEIAMLKQQLELVKLEVAAAQENNVIP